MKLKELIADSEIVNALLSKIDEIAREQNSYEYGLQLYDDGQKALLREAVIKWIAQAEDA